MLYLVVKWESRKIEVKIIEKFIVFLVEKYDYVLLEGVGGLMVFYCEEEMMLDYI